MLHAGSTCGNEGRAIVTAAFESVRRPIRQLLSRLRGFGHFRDVCRSVERGSASDTQHKHSTKSRHFAMLLVGKLI